MMTRSFYVVSALFLSIIGLAGCDYTVMKNASSVPPSITGSQIDFATVNQEVFQPHCISCHGVGNPSGVILDSYADVSLSLSKIQNVVGGGIMPPSSPLSDEDKNLVLDWIAEGAPEFAANPVPTPTPALPSPPLAPTYSSLNANIFTPKCVACHSATGIASSFPLVTYDDITNSANMLVNPANPSQSILYQMVLTKMMPLPGNGIPPLSDEEVATILQWITDNLPQ